MSVLQTKYEQLKEKYPDALLLFKVEDVYETFSNDAIQASKILGITLSHNADGIELAGFPLYKLDEYLPKLIRAGYRVAISEQI